MNNPHWTVHYTFSDIRDQRQNNLFTFFCFHRYPYGIDLPPTNRSNLTFPTAVTPNVTNDVGSGFEFPAIFQNEATPSIGSELKSVNFELLQRSTKTLVVNSIDNYTDYLMRNPVIQEIIKYRRVRMCEEITMRWAWGLFLCVCTPYVLTLARSIWRIIFKTTKSPRLSVVIFVSMR